MRTSVRVAPYVPQFSLLLGAGASKTSGVPLAGEMAERFKQEYCNQYPDEKLEEQTWFDTDTAYSILFERLYPTPSLRRDRVERFLEFNSPSLGYLYLVRLLEEGYFNTIFTTNFDDILNEACYLFSATVRPLVCAHDSSVTSVRLSSPRPKILKLHGDFLFDDIRNTLRETESLEKNMRDKFAQYAREFGLVVIGYSGGDRSVMEIIEQLLDDKANFAQGVFWCVPPNAKLGEHVERLERHERFRVVEIDGFDEYMAELHDKLAVVPHPVIANPYHVLGLRMSRILNSLPPKSDTGDLHTILKRDLIDLGNSVRDPEKLKAIPKPHNCLAYLANQDGNYAQAWIHLKAQLSDEASTINASYEAFNMGLKLIPHLGKPFFRELFKAFKVCKVVENHPRFFFKRHDAVLELIKYGLLEKALELLDYVRSHTAGVEDELAAMNRAQILHRLQREFPEDLRTRLRQCAESETRLLRFGAKILLKDGKGAVDEIESGIDSKSVLDGKELKEIIDWPICELLSATQRKRLAKIKPKRSVT